MLVVNVQFSGTKLWAFGARISFPRGTGPRFGMEMSERVSVRVSETLLLVIKRASHHTGALRHPNAVRTPQAEQIEFKVD